MGINAESGERQGDRRATGGDEEPASSWPSSHAWQQQMMAEEWDHWQQGQSISLGFSGCDCNNKPAVTGEQRACVSLHMQRLCVGDGVKFMGEYELMSKPEYDHVPEKVCVHVNLCECV